MRHRLAATAGVLILTSALAAPAAAHPARSAVVPPAVSVAVGDSSYTPDAVKTGIKGGARGVVWLFNNPTPRSATDTSGMGLFNSGLKSSSSTSKTYFFGFFAAGTYPYDSSNLSSLHGTVSVPIVRSARTGTTATTFTLRWATGSHSRFRYDVQIRRPGATAWRWWHVGARVDSATFRSRTKGTWSFRARLRRASTGKASRFSPVAPLKIS